MDDHFVDSIFCRQVDVKNLSESYDQKAMTYKMMKHKFDWKAAVFKMHYKISCRNSNMLPQSRNS